MLYCPIIKIQFTDISNIKNIFKTKSFILPSKIPSSISEKRIKQPVTCIEYLQVQNKGGIDVKSNVQNIHIANSGKSVECMAK